MTFCFIVFYFSECTSCKRVLLNNLVWKKDAIVFLTINKAIINMRCGHQEPTNLKKTKCYRFKGEGFASTLGIFYCWEIIGRVIPVSKYTWCGSGWGTRVWNRSIRGPKANGPGHQFRNERYPLLRASWRSSVGCTNEWYMKTLEMCNCG